MVSERAGFLDEIETVLAEAVSDMAAGFSLGQEPFLATAQDHIHTGFDELIHDGGGILAIRHAGDEASRAWLDHASGIHQARPQACLERLVHETRRTARSRNRSVWIFAIGAERRRADFDAVGMGGSATVRCRGEGVGHVPAINGDFGNPIPIQIRIRTDPIKTRRLPVGNPCSVGVEENHAPGEGIRDGG